MLRCPRMTDAPVKTPSRTRRMVRKVTLGLVALVVVLAGLAVFLVYRPIARRPGLTLATAQAPDFTLPDQNGVSTSLTTLTAHGPAVLVFYRGFW